MACIGPVAFAQQSDRAKVFDFDIGFSLEDKSTTTPVPILRHIDSQNPDGSYTYGYESGDGTFKIETRYPNGEVKGKYGYYDDADKFRIVEYGATPTEGFQPRVEGFVQPELPSFTPTPNTQILPTPRASPKIRIVRRRRPKPAQKQLAKTASSFAHFDRVSLPDQRQIQSPNTRTTPSTTTRPSRRPKPVTQRAFREQPRFLPPQPLRPTPTIHHYDVNVDNPAQNINLKTGSYTVSY